MSDAENLFEANLAVFERHFPDLHARLTAISSPLSSVVYEDGRAVDIDLGSGRFYHCDGFQGAREQAEAFVRSPAQVGYNLPDGDSFDSLVSRRIHRETLDILIRHDLTEMRLMTRGNTGFFFILGVGLGYHLPVLLEGIDTPHVVICEAFEEFLLASMRAIDWGALVALCEERKATLDIVCANTPEEMAARVGDFIEEYGPVYLDGSYYYQHYPLWTFAEARRRMINELPRQMAARGYFEDERKMVRNTVTNFQKGEFSILTDEFRMRSPIPVFVIGAGPSLDEAVPYIQQWRDHAIVVSAGTGLQPCLKMGIIPDFHVELENTYSIYLKLKHIMDEYAHMFPSGRFDGIRLVASTTLNPNVAPLFSDVYYFFRDSSSSSFAFGREFGFHSGIAPTVANTSLGTIAYMGLGDIYLFGVDCGWRDGFTHHARDTFYYTSEELKLDHMAGAYVLPGNFGGTVQSDMVFDWSRSLLEAAINAFHLSVYNCSDGALIRGAIPKVAESLHFDGEPLDRAAIMAEVFGNAPHFKPGEFFQSRPMEPQQKNLDAYEAKLFEIVDQARAEKWTFRQFHDAFWNDIVRSRDIDIAISAWVYYGSVAFFKQACIILNRVDADKREGIMNDYYIIFRKCHEDMLAEAREHLEQITAWINGGPEPEWTDGLPRVPGTTY